MFAVRIDKEEVRSLCLQKIEEKIKKIDFELVYWDFKELQKRTCMCWNSIQNTFFHNPKFPKFKIGQKWYFPVQETRQFLETWIREQGN